MGFCTGLRGYVYGWLNDFDMYFLLCAFLPAKFTVKYTFNMDMSIAVLGSVSQLAYAINRNRVFVKACEHGNVEVAKASWDGEDPVPMYVHASLHTWAHENKIRIQVASFKSACEHAKLGDAMLEWETFDDLLDYFNYCIDDRAFPFEPPTTLEYFVKYARADVVAWMCERWAQYITQSHTAHAWRRGFSFGCILQKYAPLDPTHVCDIATICGMEYVQQCARHFKIDWEITERSMRYMAQGCTCPRLYEAADALWNDKNILEFVDACCASAHIQFWFDMAPISRMLEYCPMALVQYMRTTGRLHDVELRQRIEDGLRVMNSHTRNKIFAKAWNT
jgi:hypothetical protein